MNDVVCQKLTGCSEEVGNTNVTGVDLQCVGADDICEDASVNLCLVR